MNNDQRDIVLLSFIQALKDQKVHMEETRMQRATYLFQEVMNVPMGYRFIAYPHGPFSFDLKRNLSELWAMSNLEYKVDADGESFHIGDSAPVLVQEDPEAWDLYLPQKAFVAKWAALEINHLSRLTSAIFISREEPPGSTVAHRAKKLHEWQPHLHLGLAEDSVVESDKLLAEAADVCLVRGIASLAS